jgi:signal transduction histidine kinase
MKEVSCRVLEIFFRPLAAKSIPAETLVVGTDLDVRVLLDKNERLSWGDFVIVMRNIGRAFDEDELMQIGRTLLQSPMMRFASVVARMLFSPMELYDWSFTPKRGLGNQLFNCIEIGYERLSSTEIEVSLTLPTPLEPCREFFVVTQGNFSEMPALLGYPAAPVEFSLLERGAKYRITVPQGASWLTRARRALLWPFTARSAAKELKDAHETLTQRYEELATAQSKLDRQATQLRTAHAVSTLIHGELILDRALEAIARAIVEEAGFETAEVDVDTEVDGIVIRSTARYGSANDGVAFVRELNARAGQKVGVLRVSALANADHVERNELLSFVAPTISMAIDNAINFSVAEELRRGLETRVVERTAELSQARDELAATVTHLEEAREVRERIFANVNHELRTPLSLILLAVTDVRNRAGADADDVQLKSLGTIEHGARRLLRMVDDLLLLAEGREGDIKLWLAPCDLAHAVSQVVDAWQPAARTAGIGLSIEVEGQSFVRADRDAIERVVTNLLSNALKFTPKGGSIAVRVFPTAEHAYIEVRDTGIGIDDDLRSRLFGRFERGRRSVNGKVNGSGLGLSLVKELVEGHGGTIDAESLEDGGTMFRVALPLAPADAPAPVNRARASLRPEDFGLKSSAEVKRDVYESDQPRATLLLAEDDPELRDRIARLLAEDYRVLAATDGVEALRLAKLHRPDLLVTDISMPGMDGIELTRRFRALAGSRVAPVLLLTAAGGIGDRLSGFEAGAVDYILKPFEPAELRARIRSQLALRSLALQLLESEKLAALGTLSAGLAHEMRNPANGIVNAIEPLRAVLPEDATKPGTDAAELLDVIEKCSEQIGNLSRQLLGFRRGAALEKQAIALEVLLKRVRSTSQPALAGVELRERLDYRGPVKCAEPLIAQVLTNLLDNAAYAAGRGGWVEVRSRRGEDRVIVEFEDSGPGVPAELRERIFEPFFTTKPPGDGNGLGLSTAREIVIQHGGSLGIADASGRTVFRVELPMETA